MALFECEKSSTDILNNGTMSDDEVAAFDVPPRYLFSFFFFFEGGVLGFFYNCQLFTQKLTSFHPWGR